MSKSAQTQSAHLRLMNVMFGEVTGQFCKAQAAQGKPEAGAEKLFLDCEYNGFGGALISMALVTEDGREFYEVLPCENPVAWVAQHVMPNLNKTAVTGLAEFQKHLRIFLAQFDSIHVVADWPEDIAHLCRSLITEPGWKINTPPLTMEILQIDSESAQPHNALADARGLRDVVVQTFKVSILKGAE